MAPKISPLLLTIISSILCILLLYGIFYPWFGNQPEPFDGVNANDETQHENPDIYAYLAKYNPGEAYQRKVCISRRPEFVDKFDAYLQDNMNDIYTNLKDYVHIDNTFRQFPKTSPILLAVPELKKMQIKDTDMCLQYAFKRLSEFKPAPNTPNRTKPEYQTMWRYFFGGPSIYDTDYGTKT